MRRCSPTLLVLRAIDAFKVYLPFMLVQGSIAERLPPALLWPWWILVAYYTITRVHLIFFEWLTIRYSYSAEGIAVQTGWLSKVTTRAAWSQVGAFHVEQDFFHQLLNRFQVRAVIGAEGRADIKLEALDAAAVAELREFHRATEMRNGAASASAEAEGTSTAGSGAEAPSESALQIYRARWSDYAMISVGYGQFVLLVPFLLGAWSEVADALSLPNGVTLLDGLTSGSWAMITGFVVAAALFGIVRAVLTFGGYTVTADDDGFEARGGMWARHLRRARRDEVQGVRISQNPLMWMLGRYSVSLVLTSARGEFRSLVVMPAARGGVVRQLVAKLVPESASQGDGAGTPIGVVLAVVVLGPVVACILALTGLLWFAAGTLLMALLVANFLWVRVWPPATDSAVFRHLRGLLWRREYVMHTDSLRLMEILAMPGLTSTRVARLRVMDRRAVWLWLPLMTSSVVATFATRVLDREIVGVVR